MVRREINGNVLFSPSLLALEIYLEKEFKIFTEPTIINDTRTTGR